MTLDLGAYFDRIGYGGEAAPNLKVLRALMAAHTGSIPFENLDPLMGVPVDDLSPAALTDKLVHRRRGGYCYEQNGLLGYALAEIGFRVRRLAGRVVWMQPPDAAARPDAHGVGGDVPGLAGRLPGRRRLRWPDVALAHPFRDRQRPADHP